LRKWVNFGKICNVRHDPGGCSPACSNESYDRQAGQLVRAKMYYVYVLKSKKDNKFYTGFTLNLDKRINEHNKGRKSTRSTLNRGPFELVHVEFVADRVIARKLEKYFKSGFGREIIAEIEWWL